MNFGARMREERTRLRLTQPAFAKAAKSSTRSVASWEADQAKPTSATLANLSEIGVDVSYLLTGERGHFNPKNLAEFESNALTKPIPAPLFRGLVQARDERILELRQGLEKYQISLSDLSLGQVVHVLECYNIPIGQMTNLIASIAIDVQTPVSID